MQIRQKVKLLTLSAAGVASLFAAEGFVTSPMLPNKHDRPTICYGNTYYPDGSPVKLSDSPKTREECNVIAAAHLKKDEARFAKGIAEVSLFQAEYDVYRDFVYNYGFGAWERSSMVRNLKQGNHVGACRSLLLYKNITIYKDGKPTLFDCSTPNNRTCRGVWTRTLERYNKCMAAQKVEA